MTKTGKDHHNYGKGKLGPIKKDLTMARKNWLAEYVETGNATEAAMRAFGFKKRDHANHYANNILKKDPQIKNILELQQDKYMADTPEAYKIQKDIMKDDGVKPEVRLKASMDIQDRAGLKPTSKSIAISGKLNIAELFRYDQQDRKTIVIEGAEEKNSVIEDGEGNKEGD